jgi:hypothetical protein
MPCFISKLADVTYAALVILCAFQSFSLHSPSYGFVSAFLTLAISHLFVVHIWTVSADTTGTFDGGFIVTFYTHFSGHLHVV